MKLIDFSKSYSTLFDKYISIKGWIISKRYKKEIVLHDGSNSINLHLIIEPTIFKHIHNGSSILINGIFNHYNESTLSYTIIVNTLHILGNMETEYSNINPVIKLKNEYREKYNNFITFCEKSINN